MAVKITDLTAATSAANSDVLVIDDGSVTKKITKENLFTDNTLTTTNKNVVGGINELKSDLANKQSEVNLSIVNGQLCVTYDKGE